MLVKAKHKSTDVKFLGLWISVTAACKAERAQERLQATLRAAGYYYSGKCLMSELLLVVDLIMPGRLAGDLLACCTAAKARCHGYQTTPHNIPKKLAEITGVVVESHPRALQEGVPGKNRTNSDLGHQAPYELTASLFRD